MLQSRETIRLIGDGAQENVVKEKIIIAEPERPNLNSAKTLQRAGGGGSRLLSLHLGAVNRFAKVGTVERNRNTS